MGRSALILLVTVAAVLPGCARTIDSGKAERTISAATAQRTGSKIRSVACPSEQTAKRGRRFSCRVVARDGTRGDVRATVTDGAGTVMLRVPFRDTRATERSMAAALTRRGHRRVGVDCPDLIARRKGVRFTCRTVSGRTRGLIRARQINSRADVRFRAVQIR